jgi:hypothetical protein
MAEKRMLNKTIIDSDAFLDMPLTTQALYFHLNMRADDDGFVNNPKKIQRTIGAGDDDLRLLIMKKFIIAFQSGIIVIKHWKMHNYIQADRYKPTVYQEEKNLLKVKSNKSYTLDFNEPEEPLSLNDVYSLDTECVQDGDTDKIRLDKNSIERENKFSPPSIEEIKKYCLERNNSVDAETFFNFYEAKGWMVGRNKMKNWKSCVITWEKRDNKDKPASQYHDVPDLPEGWR